MATTKSERDRAVLVWSTWLQCGLRIATGKTFRPASRVALVVGTILSLANQGHLMLAADMSAFTWVRVGFNYLVPYVVSSIGFLMAFRELRT